MKSKNHLFEILRGVSYLTQVGLSVAAPIILCLMAALWLNTEMGIGLWILPVGLLIGLLSGIVSLWNFLRFVNKKAHRDRGDTHEN